MDASLPFCCLCVQEGHTIFQCPKFSGKELAVYCDLTHTIYVMWHTNWPEAVMGDLFDFIETAFGLPAKHFHLFHNQAMLGTDPSIRCADACVTPGSLVYSLSRSDCLLPARCPNVQAKMAMCITTEAECKILTKHAEELFHAHVGVPYQKFLEHENDSESEAHENTAEKDEFRHTSTPAATENPQTDSSADQSQGVLVPSVSFHEFDHRNWADFSLDTQSTPPVPHHHQQQQQQQRSQNIAEPQEQPPQHQKRTQDLAMPEQKPNDGVNKKITGTLANQTVMEDCEKAEHSNSKGRRLRRPQKGRDNRNLVNAAAAEPSDSVTPRTKDSNRENDHWWRGGRRNQKQLNGPNESAGSHQKLSSTTIFIRFIPRSLNDVEFMKLVAPFGTVLKVRRCSPRSAVPSFGKAYEFAFVEYAEIASAERAIEGLDRFYVLGRTLQVEMSRQTISASDESDAAIAPDHFRPCGFGGADEIISKSVPREAGSEKKNYEYITPPAQRQATKTFFEALLTGGSNSSSRTSIPPVQASFNTEVAREEEDDQGYGMPLKAKQSRHPQLMIHDSPGVYSEAFEDKLAGAERECRAYVTNSTDNLFCEAHKAALDAFLAAKRSTLNQLRSAVLLVALFSHREQYSDAVKHSYDFFANVRNSEDSDEPSPLYLNLLLTLGLLVEKFDTETAERIFRKVSMCAAQSGLQQLPPKKGTMLLPSVLPGVSDCASAILSGTTQARLFN